MISSLNNCSELESPSPESARSLMMVVTSKPDDSFSEFSQEVLRYNKEAPFFFSDPFSASRKQFTKVQTEYH